MPETVDPTRKARYLARAGHPIAGGGKGLAVLFVDPDPSPDLLVRCCGEAAPAARPVGRLPVQAEAIQAKYEEVERHVGAVRAAVTVRYLRDN